MVDIEFVKTIKNLKFYIKTGNKMIFYDKL